MGTFKRQINESSKTNPRTWDKPKYVTQIHDDLSHQSFTFHVKKNENYNRIWQAWWQLHFMQSKYSSCRWSKSHFTRKGKYHTSFPKYKRDTDHFLVMIKVQTFDKKDKNNDTRLYCEWHCLLYHSFSKCQKFNFSHKFEYSFLAAISIKKTTKWRNTKRWWCKREPRFRPLSKVYGYQDYICKS